MNRLSQESSPYLKQHEHNPVDWYPWVEEALEKARKEDKPILVSIGYSACHWCHVMAHECFENPHLAAIMNAHFINIKVDREERPDVDAIYMDALHAMGLRGGWPLNVFLMPDAKPFYGGTYFPAKNWQNILLGIENAFVNEREKLQESADSFANSLNRSQTELYHLFGGEFLDNNASYLKEEVYQIVEKLSSNFDKERGGMMHVPKFPMPNIWHFILKFLENEKNEDLADQLRLTLNRILLGGIFDHMAGGWTRYSTDGEWKVPHFEKMLYDNAQLMGLYADSIKYLDNYLTKEEASFYTWGITQTANWLKKEMQNPANGFYAALDADSEGEEGKYYIWNKVEVKGILDTNYSKFASLYNFSDTGNWENGHNILHLCKFPEEGYRSDWQVDLETLKIFRDKRIRPGLDDKIICSWNALMISGLLKAAVATKNKIFEELAIGNAEYMVKKMFHDIGVNKAMALWHIDPLEGKERANYIFGFLDDYATTIQAFCDLYQYTFHEHYLEKARSLTNYVLANFVDVNEPLFFYTDCQTEKLIARKKEIFDNVIPSSNSMLAHAFFDLGTLLADDDLIAESKVMFSAVRKMSVQHPKDMAHWAALGLKLSTPIPEVVISGPDSELFKKQIRNQINYSMYILGSDKPSDLQLLADRYPINGETLIYICQNRVCNLPVKTVNEAIQILNEIHRTSN